MQKTVVPFRLAAPLTGLFLILTACTPSDPPLVTPAETRSMTPLATRILELTNQTRAQGVTCQGVVYAASPALTEDRTLTAAAQHRADDLASTQDFRHDPANGRSYTYWLGAVSFGSTFNYRSVGENLGMGDTPEIIVAAWKASTTGHCESQFTGQYLDSSSQQLRPGFTRVGVGEAVHTGSGQHYWTLIFAN